MKTVALACLAAALAAGALAAARPVPVPVYDAPPMRAYEVLGPVSTTLDVRPFGQNAASAIAPALVAEARVHHGRAVEAVVVIDSVVMPNGRSLLARGLAVAWN